MRRRRQFLVRRAGICRGLRDNALICFSLTAAMRFARISARFSGTSAMDLSSKPIPALCCGILQHSDFGAACGSLLTNIDGIGGATRQFLCAALSAGIRVVCGLPIGHRQASEIGKLLPHHDADRPLSAPAATRALSSASKRPDLAVRLTSASNPPRSSRHMVGANAATADPASLEKHLELSAVASVVGQGLGRRSIWPLPRTIAQSPIIWSIDFCPASAGGELLQDIDALALPQPSKIPLSLRQNRSRVARRGICRPHACPAPLTFQSAMSFGDGSAAARRVEFELQALRRRIGLQRHHAVLARSVGRAPTAPPCPFFRAGGILRTDRPIRSHHTPTRSQAQ